MKYSEKEEILREYIQKEYNEIILCVDKRDFEEALHKIAHLAYIFYRYNQTFRNDFLEEMLEKIVKTLPENIKTEDAEFEVMFYDGFGFDVRGLAQIYLEALGSLGYSIIYVTRKCAENKQPIMMKMFQKYSIKVAYISEKSLLDRYHSLINMCNHIPKIAFIYTTPWDVAGIMAFMKFEGLTKRYMINLTDHAFWLGVNSFDYCLEFRNFGASISEKYRKIPANRLIIQPYYPALNKDIQFQGFPFEKKEDDFVIFSGGALYKTFDEKATYYECVSYCLNCSDNIKFWYAGEGDTSELNKLKKAYPERVYHTSERSDLYQIFCNIDMYLDTYPIGGGLMLQYSAVSGHAPLTLCEDDSSDGVLIENKILISKSINQYKTILQRYIQDEEFRKQADKSVEYSVITREMFERNLNQIITSDISMYLCQTYNVNFLVSADRHYNYFFEHIYSNLI